MVDVPGTLATPAEIARLAIQLSPRELRQLVQTLEAGAYEIASSYVWTRAMAGLKRQLAGLGVEFLAEMLERTDIKSGSEAHEVLTDYDAVRLAEELGMFDSTHALRLRQTLELVQHFSSSGHVGDEMMPEEAIRTLRTCVQTVLGHEELEVAVEFAAFRERLGAGILASGDPDVSSLRNSAYFFKRTALRTVLSGVKSSTGARLEHLLANLNMLLPELWPSLRDPDRFTVGRAYSELHNEGQTTAASGIRSALLKVSGFDYVPETLRSRTFMTFAGRVQDAHFGWDNFHNETAPMKALASLGTSVPIPAFAQCMTAILCVLLGNPYGVSFGAEPFAKKMLNDVTQDRWQYFFDQCLALDAVLLGQLETAAMAERWCQIVSDTDKIGDVAPLDKGVRALLQVSQQQKVSRVMAQAGRLRQAMRG